MRAIVTGASRGIGAAVARRLAAPGARIALLARSHDAPSHRGLEGTLAEVAKDVEAGGATAIPIAVDLRDPHAATDAAARALVALGGELTLLVNNASALDLQSRPPPGRQSLVLDVNARGTLAVSLACVDALKACDGAMVTLSPPVRLDKPEWIAAHPHYTLSKYAMTLATLGFAADGVRANTLWPRRTVATAATQSLETVLEGAFTRGRHPDDVARAVRALALSAHRGRCFFDDELIVLPRALDAPLDLFCEAETP